jgi:hypothetical protein
MTTSADVVTVVSGLPRSGTSMMMKMLEAGGLPVVTDALRAADADNPQGYYEIERVKQLEHDKAWVADARGKVVKVISALLAHLPPEHRYRVVFMRRDLGEVLASQKQMLVRRGEPTDAVPDDKMAGYFTNHVKKVEAWLAAQPNVETLYVSYNEMLADPAPACARVAAFLGGDLDAERMAAVVSGELYRQRR